MTVLPTDPYTRMTSPFRPEPGDGTARTGRLMLVALPSAVSTARRFARFQLDVWNLPQLVDSAELVMSEIVANAVRHTGTLINGRGLLLVSAYAAGWGWYPAQRRPGKVVQAWFTLVSP